MKANTKNLFKKAFETLELLQQKKITPEDAKAVSNIVKQANNLLKYELDKAKAIEKFENIEIKNIEE